MEWMSVLCILSVAVNLFLVWKVWELRRAADELRVQFAKRIADDTNVGIDLSTSDVKMRQLAVDMDCQLKLLREEHIRYVRGDEEIKRAVTNISHDLRTPLTAICGYLELLREEEMSVSVRRYFDIVENRVAVLKELAEELFRYSVVRARESDGQYGTRESVSLNAVIEDCVAGHYGVLREAGIVPEITLPGQEVVCTVNRQALVRILSNIMGNIVKYSQGDCAIVLTEGGILRFSNRTDSLDEVSVGHLFDRFFTVESGERATGLGLSIARTLTEEMGGEMSACYKEGKLTITLDLSELPSV